MLRRISFTALFYLLLAGILIFLSRNFRSGPCTPNLDVLGYLLALIGCFILFVRYLVKTFTEKNKMLLLFALIHASALGLLLHGW
ncbi:MAG: hypothetical protein JO301_07505 [Chitinophagaceae bacterium]|nr:hypothetical protein [Chitinophagaceae bacterium]